MANNLNPVKPSVRIDGDMIAFESLRLDQGMNDCHSFEVVCEYQSQDELWKASAQKLLGQVGSKALIKFEHVDSGVSYEFSGCVTDVKIGTWDTEPDYAEYGHQSNRLHIIGHGDVVKLADIRGLDSFVDKSLKDIFSDNSKYTSKAVSSVKCNPKFTGVLPYVMRYNESVFGFFNRLSSIFGELFFYDGKVLSFGKPDDSETVKLTLGENLISLRTCASATPRAHYRYGYIAKDDQYLYEKSSVGGVSGLMQSVDRKNGEVYDKSNFYSIPSEYPVDQKGQLKDILKAKQSSADGSLVHLEGLSRTCGVRIGGQIEVDFTKKMGVSALGKYRVMHVTHQVDKMGNYSNRFEASPLGSEPVPTDFYENVKAFPEIATVLSNADPQNQGRVQVQFAWQTPCSKNTNWIRVQSPDAGGSGMKNRGLVFVPEKGDQVMVGFEFGDPNRPYVMGSMFTGKNSKGGGNDNRVHSIWTKSGLLIEFDDDSSNQGITICDANGNEIHLQAANNSIRIAAGEDIDIVAKNINLNASDSIYFSSGKNFTVSVGGEYKKEVEGNATDSFSGNLKTEIAGESSLNVKKQHVIVSKDKFSLSVDKEVKVKSSKDMSIESGGELNVKSSKDSNLAAGGKMNVNGSKNVFIGK